MFFYYVAVLPVSKEWMNLHGRISLNMSIKQQVQVCFKDPAPNMPWLEKT